MKHARPSKKQLILALVVTSVLTTLEVIGAWRSHSMALWGEAAHFVADAWAFAVAWFALTEPVERSYTFGRRQALAQGSLINAFMQMGIGAWVAWAALQRWLHPQPIEGGWMLGVAAFSLVLNLALMRWFGGRHVHEDDAIEGARIHFLADSGLCAATVGAATLIALGGPVWVDSLLALLAAALMIVTAWRLLKRVWPTLLAAAPTRVALPALSTDLNRLEGVCEVHHLHVWEVGHLLMSSVHLLLDGESREDEVLSQAQVIFEKAGIDHPTIQLERTCAQPECI